MEKLDSFSAPIQPQINLGECSLKLSIDSDEVNRIIARLERALDAFKREWNATP